MESEAVRKCKGSTHWIIIFVQNEICWWQFYWYMTIISNLTSWLKSCNNWMKLIWCAFEIDQNKHCFETFYFIFIDIYLHRRRKWHLWLNSFRTKSKNFESFKLKSFFLIVQIIESCNFLIIYFFFNLLAEFLGKWENKWYIFPWN